MGWFSDITGFFDKITGGATKVAGDLVSPAIEKPLTFLESIEPASQGLKGVGRMTGLMRDAPFQSFINQQHRDWGGPYGQVLLPIAGGVVGGIATYGNPGGISGGAAIGTAMNKYYSHANDKDTGNAMHKTFLSSLAGQGVARGASNLYGSMGDGGWQGNIQDTGYEMPDYVEPETGMVDESKFINQRFIPEYARAEYLNNAGGSGGALSNIDPKTKQIGTGAGKAGIEALKIYMTPQTPNWASLMRPVGFAPMPEYNYSPSYLTAAARDRAAKIAEDKNSYIDPSDTVNAILAERRRRLLEQEYLKNYLA